MTLLWAEIAPDNVEVQQQAAFELIKMHKLPEALSHMEKVLELEGPASFDRVAMHAKSLPRKSAPSSFNCTNRFWRVILTMASYVMAMPSYWN